MKTLYVSQYYTHYECECCGIMTDVSHHVQLDNDVVTTFDYDDHFGNGSHVCELEDVLAIVFQLLGGKLISIEEQTTTPHFNPLNAIHDTTVEKVVNEPTEPPFNQLFAGITVYTYYGEYYTANYENYTNHQCLIIEHNGTTITTPPHNNPWETLFNTTLSTLITLDVATDSCDYTYPDDDYDNEEYEDDDDEHPTNEQHPT